MARKPKLVTRLRSIHRILRTIRLELRETVNGALGGQDADGAIYVYQCDSRIRGALVDLDFALWSLARAIQAPAQGWAIAERTVDDESKNIGPDFDAHDGG